MLMKLCQTHDADMRASTETLLACGLSLEVSWSLLKSSQYSECSSHGEKQNSNNALYSETLAVAILHFILFGLSKQLHKRKQRADGLHALADMQTKARNEMISSFKSASAVSLAKAAELPIKTESNRAKPQHELQKVNI